VLDERLREFERRRQQGTAADEIRHWLEQLRAGTLAPEARPIVERVSAGTLPRERVALAAYLGDPLALSLILDDTIVYASFMGDVEAVHVVLGDDPLTWEDLAAWLPPLSRWTTGVAIVRAFVAIARRFMERSDWFRVDPDYGEDFRGRTITALVAPLIGIDAWLACPCPQHARTADPAPVDRGLYGPVYSAIAWAVELAARTAFRHPNPGDRLAMTERDAKDVIEEVRSAGMTPGELHRTVRDALTPWALAP
jgi:hypothetical protein